MWACSRVALNLDTISICSCIRFQMRPKKISCVCERKSIHKEWNWVFKKGRTHWSGANWPVAVTIHFRRRNCLPRPQLRAWSSSIMQVDQSSSSKVTLSQGQSSANFVSASSSPSSHSSLLLPKIFPLRDFIRIFRYPERRVTMVVSPILMSTLFMFLGVICR